MVKTTNQFCVLVEKLMFQRTLYPNGPNESLLHMVIACTLAMKLSISGLSHRWLQNTPDWDELIQGGAPVRQVGEHNSNKLSL
jgi:hypothetical protein